MRKSCPLRLLQPLQQTKSNWSSSTGYGQHGDYIFGWKEDALQKAMDNRCTGDSCPGVMKTQTADEAMACTLPQTVQENIEGCKFSQPILPCTNRVQ
jgi:hypothetical protein